MRLSTLAALTAVLTLSACSSLGPAGPAPGPDVPAEPTETTYPAYETFDPAGYEAEPPAAPATVIHDVPPAVMAGRVIVPGGSTPSAPAEPQPVQVEGYRVQVFSGSTRDAAERAREEAVRWWEQAQSQPDAPRTMEAVVAYLQPYYRVRLGAFATREEADAALALVRRQYPEAFLVADTVTVMR